MIFANLIILVGGLLRFLDFIHGSKASGAYVYVLFLAVFVNNIDLLNVRAPGSSIFTVGMADFVAAHLTFTTNAAYFRHR